jgi:23S rRNA (cytidine1920-2'-O)/16S rRNA (cytidine1409-2'-O)-methyltransferase
VTAEHDAVELERELLGIGRRREMAFADRDASGLGELVDPVARGADQRVAWWSRSVVELGARTDEETAAGSLSPRDPVFEQRAYARLTTRLAQRRNHDRLYELPAGLFDDRDVERFFRSEVREQTALRQLGLLGEPADRDVRNADDRRELERPRENRLSRLFAFGHVHRIERSFYLSSRGVGVVTNSVPRERLDKLLVDRGLAASRERANALVMSGNVLVDGHAAGKPGSLVDVGCEIALRAEDHPYVSRGALKLVKGLDAFAIDPAGAVCLDIGASTGGFTDVLLRRGATRVYAIDVGYGQLAWSLRQDPRVVVLERENARNMDLALVPEPCGLAVLDVSFISLTLVLPRVAELLRPPAGKPIVALVKPQFEVGRDLVGKGGVVRDAAVRRSAVDKIREWASANGFVAGDDVESPITGPAGNVEYLLLLRTA